MSSASDMPSATKFLVKLIITAVAVSFAIAIVPCMTLPADNAMISIFALSLFLALINITIKPILQWLSLPLSVLTVGVFAVVVNTAMLYLAVWCADTFFMANITINGFWLAFAASIIISIATWILSNVASLD